MKKRILIIIILILVILGIGGSLYFISYKNDSQAKTEKVNETSSMPENIISSIADDTNTVVNEIENNPVEENAETTITETNIENPEVVETKKETQTTTKNTQSSTQTKSSPSNNNSSTPKKETVKQSTSQETQTTTPASTPASTSTTTTNPTPQTSSNQSNKQEETKVEPKVERCTNNHNHSLDVGNSGKWFSSKNEAIAYYDNQVSYWGNQWETEQIDDAKYYKNCPSGYEVWSCMYCGKWTINFYYR